MELKLRIINLNFFLCISRLIKENIGYEFCTVFKNKIICAKLLFSNILWYIFVKSLTVPYLLYLQQSTRKI